MEALILFIPLAVMGLVLMAPLAIGIGWLLVRLRIVRKTWQLMLALTLVLIAIPASVEFRNRAAQQACIAENGPMELSCTGELGGLFMDLIRWGVMLGALGAGPWAGRRLGRRWLAGVPD